VIDKTGIAGIFDIGLELSASDMFPLARMTPSGPDGSPTTSDPRGASIFAAVQKLGLKLKSGRGSASFLVIDHIERPFAN